MFYLPLNPTGQLSKYIDTIFYLNEYCPEHSVERLVPDGYISIVIELDGQERYIYDNNTLEVIQTCTHSWLSGMHDKYISFSSLNNTELLAFRLFPGGLFPFLGKSVYTYKNKVVDARDVFGDEIDWLRNRILAANQPEMKLKVVSDWLTNLLSKGSKPTPIIQISCQQILEKPTIKHIKNVVDESGYSEKQFIHLFKKEIGLTPKIFQRIIKFTEILPKIKDQAKIKWPEISEECGYYDQPHFIRDFKRFSGYNPTEFIEESFDRLNFFPEKEK